MPAFSALTINDGAATPVSHTFGQRTLIGTEASFVDRSGGITLGYPLVIVNSMPPTRTSRLSKVRVKVVLPVMETVNASTYNGITPAPTKAYDLTFDGMFFLPERCTLAQRKDILAYAKNLLSNALTTALVETQETVY